MRAAAIPEAPIFALYVMFSEGVQFNSAEIADAVLEDFPELDIEMTDALCLPTACDTDATIPMAPLFMGATGADASIISMMRLPGYGTWDPNGVEPRHMLACTDIDLKDALGRNKSYLCISAGAKSPALEDCFRAARLVSCVGAVFAQLPICLAAYWESGTHFISPKEIGDMAHEAMGGDWPIRQWVGLGLSSLGSDRQGRVWSSGATIGLRHFTGYEMQQVAAPVDVTTTAATLHTAAWLPLASGNRFSDGDTCGVEGPGGEGGVAEKMRLRWLPKGAGPKNSKTPPLPHDTFIMIHPDSPFDEAAYFGTPRSPKGRKQQVTQHPRPGFFKRMLSRTKAS